MTPLLPSEGGDLLRRAQAESVGLSGDRRARVACARRLAGRAHPNSDPMPDVCATTGGVDGVASGRALRRRRRCNLRGAERSASPFRTRDLPDLRAARRKTYDNSCRAASAESTSRRTRSSIVFFLPVIAYASVLCTWRGVNCRFGAQLATRRGQAASGAGGDARLAHESSSRRCGWARRLQATASGDELRLRARNRRRDDGASGESR